MNTKWKVKGWCLGILLCAVLFAGCKEGTLQHKTLAIQPYGFSSNALIDSVGAALHDYYGFNVVVLEEKSMPSEAFVNVKSPRYRADSMLNILEQSLNDSIDFILGLTNKDISVSKRDESGNILKPLTRYADWGVIGLGRRPGACCIASIYRPASL